MSRASSKRRWLHLNALLLVLGLVCAAAAPAQTWPPIDHQAPADWREGDVPAPPALRTSGLIDIEMPRAATVRMGLDPDSLRIDRASGVVRYVVVAQGPSALSAMYEGIRCSTGEYRVYARKVQDGAWQPNTDEHWLSMRANPAYGHPLQLARGGVCIGVALPDSVPQMLRELRALKGGSLYY